MCVPSLRRSAATLHHTSSIETTTGERISLRRAQRCPAPSAATLLRLPSRTFLQPDQARELLARLHGHPLYLLASLGLATGMRRNEMLALRWRDLDLDAGRLTVEQALEQTRAHGIRTKAPKTKHGRRTISLPAHIVVELRDHWRAQQEQRMMLGMGRSPDASMVLANHDGTPQTPDTVSKAWERTMDAIG